MYELAQRHTHTKRQATQHGWLPSLLGDGDKSIEIVYDRKKIFYTGPARAAKAEQKSLVSARQAQQTNKERTPSSQQSQQFQQSAVTTPL